MCLYIKRLSTIVTLEHGINICSLHLRGEEADKEDYGEAAKHGDGTAIDGIDRITKEHVDNGQTDTPDETSPYSSRRYAAPVKTEHERSQESTSQCTP